MTPQDQELASQLDMLWPIATSDLGLLARRLASLRGFEADRARGFAADALDAIGRIRVDRVVADTSKPQCPEAGCCVEA